MINSFLLALAMYSRVPMPGPDWEKEKIWNSQKRYLQYFWL